MFQPKDHKGLIIGLTVLFILGLLLSGCSAQNAEQQKMADSAETISVYTIADAAGDWGFPSPWGHYQRGPGYVRMSLIFDTLVWKDDQGVVPAVASAWQYDESSKTYTFTLRDDVLWHDGEKLQAEDVLFTFNYMREHPYTWGDLSSIAQVVSEGDQTVKITLKEHFAPFLSNVAATVPIIPKHIWERVQDPAKYTDPAAVIGCGPFTYADYNKEQGTYLYQANEHYYGGTVNVQLLKFVKTNPQMAVASLTQGEVNAASLKPEMVEQLKDHYTIISETGSANVKLVFNHQKAPMAVKEFRQAMAYAINTEDLAAKVLRGYGEAGNPGIFAPGNAWYNPAVAQYPVDLDKVQQIMGDLGYRLQSGQEEKHFWTKDGRTLSLDLLCDADSVRAAEVLKEQLEAAGFQIEIQSVETKVRDSKLVAWDFDLALNSHGGLGGDPEIFNKFILADGFNSARYESNAELTALVEKQQALMDETQRKEAVAQIQAVFAEEIPTLTLYYPNSYWAHDGQISLFYTNEGIAIGVPIPLNKLSFVTTDP